jgi:hypothetical protein
MKDPTLFFRNTTDSLLGNETSGWLDLGGAGRPLAMTVVIDLPYRIPGDILTAKVLQSDDGIGAVAGEEIGLFELAATATAYAYSTQKRRQVVLNHRYVALELTITGTGTHDYGPATASLELGGTSFGPAAGLPNT